MRFWAVKGEISRTRYPVLKTHAETLSVVCDQIEIGVLPVRRLRFWHDFPTAMQLDISTWSSCLDLSRLRSKDPWLNLRIAVQLILLSLVVTAILVSSLGLFLTTESVRSWCSFHNLCWSNLLTSLLVVPTSKPRQWMIIWRFASLCFLTLCALSGALLVLCLPPTTEMGRVCVSVPASSTLAFTFMVLFETRHETWFGLAPPRCH